MRKDRARSQGLSQSENSNLVTVYVYVYVYVYSSRAKGKVPPEPILALWPGICGVLANQSLPLLFRFQELPCMAVCLCFYSTSDSLLVDLLFGRQIA